MVTAPIMEYNLSINGQSIIVNSTDPIRASFNPPYNVISGTYKSTNISLSRFEIRITAADADFDIDNYVSFDEYSPDEADLIPEE